MQKKDVIYIDVEDDITAIIGKVKAAKEKIVALVPPKRTGVLQSAVNLRLLARTADKADKRLVLITGNSALGSLAASAKIPVAKTLQSPPKLADLPDEDENSDDEDVIEGDKLPVGDHAGLKDDDAEEIIIPADLENLDMDSDAKPKKEKAADAKKKPTIKVPDLGTFRKKMVLGISAGVLLIVFLVWAAVFAPHATIIVSAKTSPVDVKTTISLGDSLSNDPDKNTLNTITQTDKSSQDIDFTATGKKEVGTKASGTVELQNYSPTPATISSGTIFTSGSNSYIVQSTVSLNGCTLEPAGFGSFKCNNPPSADGIKVQASDVGSGYNLDSGTQLSDSADSNVIAVVDSSGITGGDSHNATVVSANDVQKALDQIKQQNSDDEKNKLKSKFDKDITVIDASFSADAGSPKITPGIGEEVSDGEQAKLTVEVTYSVMGVAKDALDSYLREAINQQLNGDDSKRVYDTGASSATFSDFQASTDKKPATISMATTGQVGIKIDDNQIKSDVEGKRSGEVISDLRQIDGISDVSVNLSPFWVGSVPNDPNKITIQFKLLKND